MKVEETVLPGLGKKVTLRGLSGGHTIAVVTLKGGEKELYVDADGIRPLVVRLQADEARLLGRALSAEHLPKTFVDYVSRAFQGGMALDQCTVRPGSPAEGRSVAETHLRAESGATIIAVVRQGEQTFNPPASWEILAGDVLVMLGQEDQLDRARRILMGDESE